MYVDSLMRIMYTDISGMVYEKGLDTIHTGRREYNDFGRMGNIVISYAFKEDEKAGVVW